MKVFFALSLSCLIVSLCFHPKAFAQGVSPRLVRDGGQPAENISVLQNRFFLKSWRPEIGLLGGRILDEAYIRSISYGLRGSVFFSEWLGAEVQYQKVAVRDSEDRRALDQLRYRDLEDTTKIVNPEPQVNPISAIQDYNVVFAPFYGKLSLVNWMIVYLDLYLTTGISRVTTEQGVKTALSYSIGQRFYVKKNFSFRVDFRTRSFVESRNNKDSRRNVLSLDLGASYFLF